MPLLYSGRWAETGMLKGQADESEIMPGVNYPRVCELAPMTKVLDWIGFEPRGTRGDQLHGPCPVHGSRSPRSRVFSVEAASGVCFCRKCGFTGNQIQLWERLTGLSRYRAAIDLCRQAGVDVPWIERW